jgi:hypothetical protein
MTNFEYNKYYKDGLDLEFFIKLLTYYVSVYNQKSHLGYKIEYDAYLLSIREKIIKKIQLLLL